MTATGSEKTANPDRIKFRILVVLIVLSMSAVSLLFHSTYLFDPHKYVLRKILSLGHIPLFALIAWMVLLTINIKISKISDWPVWSYAAALIGTAVIGLSSEAAQIMTPRDASIKDLFFNVTGASFSLGFGLLWFNTHMALTAGRKRKKIQILFIAASAAILIIAVYPLVSALIDEMEIKKQFPVIASFETEREIKRWRGDGNELRLSRQHAAEGDHSLQATLYPHKYSGVSMPHPPLNWSKFDRLNVTIFNPSQTKLNLTLKIFDRHHNYQYTDRFNRILVVYPGKNIISIPLNEIESAPVNRKMDMTEIAQISFFLRHPDQVQILFFDDLRLVHD